MHNAVAAREIGVGFENADRAGERLTDFVPRAFLAVGRVQPADDARLVGHEQVAVGQGDRRAGEKALVR